MTDCIYRDMLLKIISHKPSSPTTEREDRLIDGFISAVKNCPAADVLPRDEAIKMGAELAAMHGSEQQDGGKLMYNELVEDLRRMANTWLAEEYKVCAEAVRFQIREAADAIEELSRENESLAKSVNEASELLQKRKPRWISVEERLPEEVRKSYLCRTDSGYHCEVRWTDNVYGLWTGGGGQWGWSIFDIPQYAKVTHWMPLPEPPEEG